MIYLLDIFGTLAFAISGAFHAVKYELDLLGVLTLATVTGIAGGILRDTVLGATPPSALTDPYYILTCIIGGLVVFWAAPKIAKKWDYIMMADAVGLSVFTAIGASKASEMGAMPQTIIIMAMITSCGGGLVRDLLVTEIPSILRRDFYASAAFCGGLTYVICAALGVESALQTTCTIIVTFSLRAIAMRYGISLPKVASLPASPSTNSRFTKATKSRAEKTQCED